MISSDAPPGIEAAVSAASYLGNKRINVYQRCTDKGHWPPETRIYGVLFKDLMCSYVVSSGSRIVSPVPDTC